MDAAAELAEYAYVNGEIVPTAGAQVSILDRGLLRGEGVFETIRSYDAVPFAVGRHVARMTRSAAATGIGLPDSETLRNAVHLANDANGLDTTRFQLTVTGGPGGPGPDPIGDPEPTTLVICAPISDTARDVNTSWS